MTETPQVTNAQDSGNPPSMPLTVNLQYTKDLSFEVPLGAAIFASLQTAPDISVNIDVQATRIEEKQPIYEIALTIRAEASEGADANAQTPARTVFIADLTYAAIVTLGEVQQELLEPLLLIEVPRLIFPYARNIICDVTRDGGFPPIVLQPIDFVALWQAKNSEKFPETAGNA